MLTWLPMQLARCLNISILKHCLIHVVTCLDREVGGWTKR